MQPGSYDRSPRGFSSVSSWPVGHSHRPARIAPQTTSDAPATAATAISAPRNPGVHIPGRRSEVVPTRPVGDCRRGEGEAVAARSESLPERLHHGPGGRRRSWSSRGRSWLRLDEDGWLGNRPSRRVRRRRSGRSRVRLRQTTPRVVVLDHHRRINRLGHDRSAARAADEDGRVGGDHLRAFPGRPPLQPARAVAGWRRLKRTRRLACSVETSQQRPGASVLRILRQRFEHPPPGDVVRVLLVRSQRPSRTPHPHANRMD